MAKLNPEQQEFLDKLYMENFLPLFYYALQFIEQSNAEEAVQNVFSDACLKVDILMKHENPVGWLKKALKFTINNIKRSKRRCAAWLVYLPPQADLEYGVERGIDDFPDPRPVDENVDILYSDIALERDFQLIKRYAIEDKSLKTIATEDNISLNACKKQVSRARENMQIRFRKSKT